MLPRLLPHLGRFRLRASRGRQGRWHVDLSSRRRSAMCPSGQRRARAGLRVYQRTVADLPLAGATLVLPLQVWRVFCRYTACGRGFLPSGFQPSSRSVAAIVWAYRRPSVRWA